MGDGVGECVRRARSSAITETARREHAGALPATTARPILTAPAIALGLLFAVAGLWRSRRRIGIRRPRTA
jgi:hypothetical protein